MLHLLYVGFLYYAPGPSHPLTDDSHHLQDWQCCHPLAPTPHAAVPPTLTELGTQNGQIHWGLQRTSGPCLAPPPLSMRRHIALHSQHSEERELLLNNPFHSYAETSRWESKGKYLGCNRNRERGNPSPLCCQQRSQLCLQSPCSTFCTSRG